MTVEVVRRLAAVPAVARAATPTAAPVEVAEAAPTASSSAESTTVTYGTRRRASCLHEVVTVHSVYIVSWCGICNILSHYNMLLFAFFATAKLVAEQVHNHCVGYDFLNNTISTIIIKHNAEQHLNQRNK